MKRFSLLLLAASSAMWPALAFAATRPHYGGTLRVAMREAPQSYDPAGLVQAGASNICPLIFETLVKLDSRGEPQANLAVSWRTEPGNQRWRLQLGDGVSFTDGWPLDVGTVAASLRAANPAWKVLTVGDTVMVETPNPEPELPAELALTRNAITRRDHDQVLGTGPFSVSQWLVGKHLTLTANDHYWAGRPFVDSIEVDFGKNDRDQMASLDLGKTDLVEVAPDNIRRARAEGRLVLTSNPSEFLALAFSNDARSEEEQHARNALAYSIDTGAINDVVLQGGGEPTTALLPNWLSGYAFLFPAQADRERARQEVLQAKRVFTFTLRYNPVDPVARTIAERILLNARDSGITLVLNTTGEADLRLVHIPLASSNPQTALLELAKALQLPAPKLVDDSIPTLYAAEKSLLQSHRIIPLLHLRTGATTAPSVRGFTEDPDGSWYLDGVWLATERP